MGKSTGYSFRTYCGKGVSTDPWAWQRRKGRQRVGDGGIGLRGGCCLEEAVDGLIRRRHSI